VTWLRGARRQAEKRLKVLSGTQSDLFRGDLKQVTKGHGDLFDPGGLVALTPIGDGREEWAVRFDEQTVGRHQGGDFAQGLIAWEGDVTGEGNEEADVEGAAGMVPVAGEAVEDAAEALMLAAERYDGAEPVNVGSGEEISIRELAELIARLCEFRGRIIWDPSKPNGQPRRRLDTTRAERYFGFRARVPLEEGLRRTIAWYRRQLGAG